MNDKFLDAMIEQSVQMMTDACHGKSLSKDEMAFIIATQKAEDKRKHSQILPNLIKNSQNILPLINSLFGNGGN